MDRLEDLFFKRGKLSDDEIVDALLSTDFEIPDVSDIDSDEELKEDEVVQLTSVSSAKLREQQDPEKDHYENEPTTSSVGLTSASCSTDPLTVSPSPRENVAASGSKPKAKVQPEKLKPTWMVKNLDYQKDITFLGNTTLPDSILNLQTPYQFFSYFFDDVLFQTICEETVRYSVMKDVNKPFNLTPLQLRKYLGILVMMSIVKLNNIRSYWSLKIGNQLIANTMSINTFEDIRRFLHFNDNSKMKPRDDPAHDRLFRLRPIIDHLLSRFRAVPLESELSIDEQVCATKIRHFMKVYNPMKPHKWGFKLFVLSGVSGFAYNFEIFSGADMDMLPEEPNLGACCVETFSSHS